MLQPADQRTLQPSCSHPGALLLFHLLFHQMQDPYADEEYILELEKQELEEIRHMMNEQDEQEQQLAEELSAVTAKQQTTVAAAAAAAPTASLKRLAVPLEPASSLGQEIRSAVEQAQNIASQLLKNKGAMKLITGGGEVLVQGEEAAPVNIIELAQAAGGSGFSAAAAGADGGIAIDVTVTTERSGSTWALPNPVQSMLGFFGQEADSSEGDAKQAELAAQIAHTVIESALAHQGVGGADQELVLDMTLENASPEVCGFFGVLGCEGRRSGVQGFGAEMSFQVAHSPGRRDRETSTGS